MRSSDSTAPEWIATGTLSIVVVNWNTGTMLRECLASIGSARLPSGWRLERVVVVDNASEDGSSDDLPDVGGVIEVVRNPANRGFAAACNQGAARCRSTLLLFLNPDTRLFDNSLAAPVSCLVSPAHAMVGIAGIQLLDERGEVARSCSRFPRGLHFLSQALGLNRHWPRLSQAMLEWDHLETREVDQVIGAFFMIRRSLFVALNGFDERFFVYFEEVDLCRRARAAGWRSLFVAQAQAFHLGGGSSRGVLDRRLMYSLRSRLLYARKHFGRSETVVTYGATLLVEPFARTLHALLRGRPGEVSAVWRGYALLLRALLARGSTGS
jgi:hypothetical protein